MLQVKFVKKPQKHILSCSKVLCAPSGEWLLPLHIFSLVTKKQFKFSNNFALELPPNFLRFKSTTFSLVCENPLRVEQWYIFNEFEVSTKPPISLVTILAAILLEYVPEGLESYMSGRSKQWLTRTLGQAERRGQIKRKAKKFLYSRLPPGMMLSVQTMHMYRFARKSPSFKVSIFYILPVFPPQLVGLFYKRPQRRTNFV